MKGFHPTEWRYIHRHGDKIIWASDIGDLDIVQFSPEYFDLLHEQPWRPNTLVDTGEQDILAVYFRAGTAPTTFYIGLCNSTPIETTTLATLTAEAAGSGYARQQITRDATGWPTLALQGGDYRADAATKTFTAAGGTIGPVTTSFLCTNAASGTTGTLVSFDALSASRTLNSGDSLDVSQRISLA
jgi:hypothetical protein